MIRSQLPYARAALAAAAGARLAVDELTGLIRGNTTIGTVTSLGPDIDLAGLLAAFHQSHPAVDIALIADNSDQLIAALQTGRIAEGPVSPPARALIREARARLPDLPAKASKTRV